MKLKDWKFWQGQYIARKSWRCIKLAALMHEYGREYFEWVNEWPPVSDDRRVYCQTVQNVYMGILSIPENPPAWIACAVNHEYESEKEMLDRIRGRFCA